MRGGGCGFGGWVGGWVMCCVVFLVCGGRGMGWSGLGVFPFDGFRGVGVGFVGRLFWREGNGWGGVFEGRGGRASGWCMVMVLGGGGS